MAIFYGCAIPDDLYYHPDHDCWVRFESTDTATLGMTDIAQTLAGKLIYIKFKAVGKKLQAGKNAATIESAKWVGPFVMPFDAEVLETNYARFQEDILIANRDPYGEGWLIKVLLSESDQVRSALLTGAEAITVFQKRIEENDIRCFRCVDDPVPM